MNQPQEQEYYSRCGYAATALCFFVLLVAVWLMVLNVLCGSGMCP